MLLEGLGGSQSWKAPTWGYLYHYHLMHAAAANINTTDPNQIYALEEKLK